MSRSKPMRGFVFFVGALLLLSLSSCGGCGGKGKHSKGGYSEEEDPPNRGNITDEPFVPTGSSPVTGLTWHVGVTDNVPRSTLEGLHQKLVQTSDRIFHLTEGQVWIAKVRLSDNVSPGATASQLWNNSLRFSQYDVLIFPDARWNISARGFVTYHTGRRGRLLGVPVSGLLFTYIHEASHLLWILSWSSEGGANSLRDEYFSSPDDDCVMELTTLTRWCGADNHASQSGQPHSCWEQILRDYPAFQYDGINQAPASPPFVEVEYNDTP